MITGTITSPKSGWKALVVPAVISAVWLGVWAFVASQLTICREIGLMDCVTSLALNELGDMLAGAFAPIAFLWLVVAVLLQRSELQAQREELRLAREVSQAQVNEAKKNVDLLASQTNILEAQYNSAVQKNADQEYIELADLFFTTYEDVANDFVIREVDTDNFLYFTKRGGGSTDARADNAVRSIAEVARIISGKIEQKMPFEARGTMRLATLSNQARAIGQTIGRASLSTRLRLESNKILEASTVIDALAEDLNQHGHGLPLIS